jgi:hypothetical protein
MIKIIDQQVTLIGAKSAKAPLSNDDVGRLRILAETFVAISANLKTKRRRPYMSGERISDEDLLNYAK